MICELEYMNMWPSPPELSSLLRLWWESMFHKLDAHFWDLPKTGGPLVVVSSATNSPLRLANLGGVFHFNRIVAKHSVFHCFVNTRAEQMRYGHNRICHVSLRYGWSDERPLDTFIHLQQQLYFALFHRRCVVLRPSGWCTSSTKDGSKAKSSTSWRWIWRWRTRRWSAPWLDSVSLV